MNNHDSHQTSRSSGPAHGSNYWQLLAAAVDALEIGDYPAAERRYWDACDLRETSPGRVFVTEKIGDGVRRLFQRGQGEKTAVNLTGRWTKAQEAFVQNFMSDGERIVREGVRVSDLRPEDDAESNQPVLESALFLVARSRLFQEEPASAVPLLKGLFRTASRTGRPFSVDLVRHDLPLSEEDRLWMARKGGELVGSFVDQGHLRKGGVEAQEWAQVFLQLLQSTYFGTSGRLSEERSWLEAVTADRLLGRAVASVDLYRAYLAINGEPGPRSDEARVRLLELLGNTHGVNFSVPRYAEALATMQAAGLSPNSAVGARFEAAIARFEYRCPEAGAAAGVSPAWASVAVEPDGQIAVVFWWDNEPRDLAFWRPGDDASALNAFLAPCEGRLLAANEETLAAVDGHWQDDPAPWSVAEFVAALMECRLPATGLDDNATAQMAIAEIGPWRAGWRSDLGHDSLEPPLNSTMAEAWQHGAAANSLQAGLVFLAVRSRIAEADIAVRAGIGEMARRGDRASQFLYEFLTLHSETQRALDASFEAWTLPLLWTRPDPFGWTTTGHPGGLSGAEVDGGIRPDLGRSDLTIVTTGNAPSVLAAWGDGKHKWRVILDRMDRLETLSQVASGVVGPVTLIPREGRVHCLAAALQMLEKFIAAEPLTADVQSPTAGRSSIDGLLAVFHWTRLVETHNGDLLDFEQVRPRPGCVVPLYERYLELVAALPTEAPSLAPDGSLTSETLRTWGGQFSQRVRKAGFVAGTVDHLSTEALTLDSLWGVFEGSDAAWVFLDSAAVHWTLHTRAKFSITDLHSLLHSRGSRHLSILLAANWQRTDLENLLAGWLHQFGNAYCLSLTDTRSPVLRLADRGVCPESKFLAREELSGQLTWVSRKFSEEGTGTICLPQQGRAASFWRSLISGELMTEAGQWRVLSDSLETAELPEAALVVPVLRSLSEGEVVCAPLDSRADWLVADAERERQVKWQRQLCALEIAALSAGPWRSVDILDVRWWRLLRPAQMVMASNESQGQQRRTWSGEQAAQLASDGIARTFDLPGTGLTGEPAGAADGRLISLVDRWLQENQFHSPKANISADPNLLTAGNRLYTGDLAPVWHQLRNHLGKVWERGELNQWALLVADEVPTGAAKLISGSGVAGISVWSDQWQGERPAPVMWVEPEDFAAPGLKTLLSRYQPAFIVADDLADWLPSADRDAQETAVALRGLLDCQAPNVLLRASSLTGIWSEFLLDVCQATAVSDGTMADVVGPDLPASATDETRLCFECGAVDRPSALASRLQTLLARLRRVLAAVENPIGESSSEMQPALDGQLLPLAWLSRLAGMSGRDLSEGVLLLRWAARLNGDTLSAAGDRRENEASLKHTLLVWQRFSAVELTLIRLRENLALLLPLWLEGVTLPGMLGCVDLERPPVLIDAQELAQVDAFLSALAESEPGLGLTYQCPRGLLNSATRMVGWSGEGAQMMPAILNAVAVLSNRTSDLMSSAVETGAGFRVDTGLTELRQEERNFLALGVAMGIWRWVGPASVGTIHLVDLLTVADSPTAKLSPIGWDLFKAQSVARFPVAIANAPTLTPGQASDGRPRLGQLRRLLTVGVEASDDLDPIVARVHELTSGPGEPAFLVLKGMLGTGRHEALVRGLSRTLHQSTDPGEVTIYCPDDAVAAMISREFTRHGYGRPVDIRTVSVTEPNADIPTGPNVLPALADPGSAVIVMCEVQRFDPETRYRVAQMGRGKLLLMTADEVSSAEGWEHLFLTTPRANDIVDLPGQRHMCKAIWSEVRGLAPEHLQPGGQTRHHARDQGRNHGRGQLESGYAANLVQSLARIVAAREEGILPDVIRLTTPLAADLDYLGGQLREQGWLVVPESEIDKLVLPGPREILAAATDQLTRAGEISLLQTVREADAKPSGGEPVTETTAETAAETEDHSDSLMMPLLLGPQSRRNWQHWCANQSFNGEQTLAEFVGSFIGSPWANTFLRHGAGRRRSEEFLAKWGAVTLRGLLDQPLWEVWWHSMRSDLGMRAHEPRRSIVLLSEVARLPGCRVPGGAYLCVGSEPIRQHYEFLGRVSDSAVVLYQDSSPLPRDQTAQ